MTLSIAKRFVLLLFPLALSLSLNASTMYKCVADDGSITFNSIGCPNTEQSTSFKAPKANVLDHSGQREWEEMREEELMATRRMLDEGSPTSIRLGGSHTNKPNDNARSALCREANTPYRGSQNRNLTARQRAMASACESGASAAQIQNISSEYKAVHSSPPSPSVITDCDNAGCWDNQGTRYNHSGGSTFSSSTGKACQNVGGTMICN